MVALRDLRKHVCFHVFFFAMIDIVLNVRIPAGQATRAHACPQSLCIYLAAVALAS